MRIVLVVFYLGLVLIGVTFAALNANSVAVNFYFSSVSIPVSVLITIAVGVGVLLGVLSFLRRYWRLKREYNRVSKQLKLTEREIKNLSAIPLQGQARY